MSLSQTMTRRRDADLLQRALDGDPEALGHHRLSVLLRLAEELPRPRVRPDPAFVAGLRDELLEQARRRPVTGAAGGARATVGTVSRTPALAGPKTLTVPRGARLLAGLATVAVLLAAVLGGVSSRALPGDVLYPVKLMIGDAQVRLAGSDLGRGTALLAQMDHRLDEVDALVAAGDPQPRLVDETLLLASDDLGDAQRELLTTDSGRPDARALQVLADAGAQATGRLSGLRDRVPLSSVPAVDRLLEQLAHGWSAMTQQLDQLEAAGACDGLCTSIRAALDQQGAQLARLLGPGWAALAGAALPGSGQVGSGTDGGDPLGVGSLVGGATTAPTSAPVAGSGSVSVPGVSLPGLNLPGASVSGDSDGGLTATVPGATASVPGVGVTVPSLSVSLPGTTSAGLPQLTVSGATSTLGDATVGLPAVSAGGDCALGLGDLCLGD
jgi:Domain of unknown function (DUF5667)